jgi:hypothetical protein
MLRTVKHFALHRIAGTELRVVSEVESGVLPLIETEEAVIRGYMGCDQWPHRCVSLFILNDLQPLLRQIHPAAHLPSGEAKAIESRPLVNVYDLADLRACHVFVNRHVMDREGYWGDAMLTKALLAHEHAHPIAENKTTRLSRQMRLQLSLPAGSQQPHLLGVLTGLAEELCLYAPREVFANQVTIGAGFGQALLQLDRRNLGNAVQALAGRQDLSDQVDMQMRDGKLKPAAASALMLVGDLRSHLALVIEIAAFFRAGQVEAARELETVLETIIFPRLEAQVRPVYADLSRRYLALHAEMEKPALLDWGTGVLSSLSHALAERGLPLHYKLEIVEESHA